MNTILAIKSTGFRKKSGAFYQQLQGAFAWPNSTNAVLTAALPTVLLTV